MPKNPKRIYLDYASITPLDPRVLNAMKPYLTQTSYNPSSLYEEGRIARNAIDQARKSVAHVLQSKPSELFFTSGGTEGNNLVLQGAFEALLRTRETGRENKKKKRMHMVTSAIEHSSVLEIFKYFETKGVDVTYLSMDEEGIVPASKVIDSLRKETVLVSLMYGNNEIGTVNDISKISKNILRIRKERKQRPIIIHTDASQGACYENIRTDYLGVDLMTLDGSKLYGPRGSGVVYIKRGTPIQPIIFGGGHEAGIRPGTENTSSIVGFAKALELCEAEKKQEVKRLRELRDRTFDTLKKSIPDIIINGSRKERLPNNINICIPGLDSEFAVIKLDLLGIACSSVTTCKNIMDDSSSYVIDALDSARMIKGRGFPCSRSSLRLSLGRFTTKKELDTAVKIIIKSVLHKKIL